MPKSGVSYAGHAKSVNTLYFPTPRSVEIVYVSGVEKLNSAPTERKFPPKVVGALQAGILPQL